jgi:hypothetical protein
VELNPALLTGTADLASQSRFATLVIKDSVYEHKAYPIKLLAQNEAAINPAFYALFIAWVTPDDPLVQDVIQRTGEEVALAPLDGYRNQDAAHTEQQICDLYTYLQQRESAEVAHRGLRYAPNPPADTSWTQKIRPPAESIAKLEANCIDEAILFASLIRALGMNPILIVIPREQHALVGWETWDGSGEYGCMQTTLIRSPHLATCPNALREGRAQCESIPPEKKIWITDIGRSADDYLGFRFYSDSVGILDVKKLEVVWNSIINPEQSRD